ncbi:MAG: hypothetical protein ACOYY2_12120 [Actinomycetota bacterium]
MARGYRYGSWHDGPDPLAPPYDVRRALDELGDAVLAGTNPTAALRGLLRRGAAGLRGLDALRAQARRRCRELTRAGRLDGTLEQVRALLDRAVGQERATLFPDPSDDARLREAQLDALPGDTARAVRELADYDWRSADARASYEEIRDLLRREVLDSQFRGLRDALRQGGQDPAAFSRLQQMLADLNALLAADDRGEDTRAQFAEFLRRHGEFFPEQPATLEELVDSLARRAAAASRLLASLSPGQREELAGLVAQAMAGTGLAEEMARLAAALRARRGDLDWGGRRRLGGENPLGLGDATTALEELADLDALDATLGQDYPGADLADVDEEAVRRALGRQAVDDLAALRRIERELQAQGYLSRRDGQLELTPKAVRRIGATALRRIFARVDATGRGDHDAARSGAAGELTGGSRPWQFGDEQPLDVARTVRNALLRTGPTGGRVRLAVDDFEVAETERRSGAAVCLLVDLSYSMVLRGTWGAAKSTALALHALVATRYPQDAIQVIGFSSHARVLGETDLVGLDWDLVQGTNLQHALLLAGRHLDRHPGAEPVVLVVTDGEPTAHLLPDGEAFFDWPPAPETVARTLAEVDRVTRRGATINVFQLDDDPRLTAFAEEIARRNGGRVFLPDQDRLGEYVVSDYLRSRRGRRPRRAG